MQIFSGNEYELKTTFGLSAMAVVWVGILRSKSVYLTEPFLELCGTGKPLESLLKDRTILSSLKNEKDFKALQEKYDPEKQFPLVLLQEGKQQIIALEDELLADQGWQNPPVQLPQALPQINYAISKQDIHLEGLESLFTPEEVAKLKMIIATAVKSEEKIEAIRKIILTNASVNEKGILFLHALGDKDLEVRKEAANALKQIGFHETIADAVDSLMGDENQQIYAINSLAQIFPSCNDLEQGAIFQIVLTTLKDQKYREHRPLLLETLAIFIDENDENQALLERIINSSIEVLVSNVSQMVDSITCLFEKILSKNPALLNKILWNELEKSKDRRLRSLLLSFLANTQLDQDMQKLLAKKIVFEIGLGDDLDPVYLKLSATLKNMQDIAIVALLDRLSLSQRSAERIALVQLIETMLFDKDYSTNLKNKILKTYTKAFPLAPYPLRLVMLDSILLEDKSLNSHLKIDFANESLVDIHQDRFDCFYESVSSAMCKIKVHALEPLFKVLKKPLQKKTRRKSYRNFMSDIIWLYRRRLRCSM